MYLNLYLFVGQVCVIYIITKCQGYVLVAANLDDFKSLARKFVPDKLADQLTDLARETSSRKENVYEQPFFPRDNYQDSYSEIQNRVKEDAATPNFNFDELVEKVKERLKQELMQKQRMKQAREEQLQSNPQNNEKETVEDEEDYEIAESVKQKTQRDTLKEQRPPQQREQLGPQNKYKQETDEYDEEDKTSSTRQKMQREPQREQRPPQQREQRGPQNKYKQETDEYDEEDKTSSTRQKMQSVPQRERRPPQHRDQQSSQNKYKQETNEYDEDYNTSPSTRQKLPRNPQREQRLAQQREQQGSQNRYKQGAEDYDEAYKTSQSTKQKLQRDPQREQRLSQQREQRGPQNKYKQETDDNDEDYKTPQSARQKMQREPQTEQRPPQQREAPQLEMEFEQDDGRHEDTEQEDMTQERPQVQQQLKPYTEQTRFKKQKKQQREQQYTVKNPDKYATVEYEADPAVEKVVYENNNNEGLEPKNNNDMSFAKMKFPKNDSYEDYVFPTKEKDVFESDQERVRVRKPVGVIQKFPKSVTYKVKGVYEGVIGLKAETPAKQLMPLEAESPVKEDNQYIVEIEEEEEKAQTGDLWYDEGAPNAKEDARGNTTPMDLATNDNKKSGTMIPKRDFYKISSPNYFANVPIAAEKYDFNEPIPDKDREPDHMERLLPLPPSVINGKVKFSK